MSGATGERLRRALRGALDRGRSLSTGAWVRLGAFTLFFAAALVLVLTLGIPSVRDAREYVESLGAIGPVIFVLGFGVLTLMPFPKSVLAVVAGALWGLGPGLALSLGGVLIGASFAFFVGRLLIADAIRGLVGAAMRVVDEAAAKSSFLAVLAVRIIPVLPFTVMNYAFGVTAGAILDLLRRHRGRVDPRNRRLRRRRSVRARRHVVAVLGGIGSSRLPDADRVVRRAPQDDATPGSTRTSNPRGREVSELPITFADVEAAAARLAEHAHRTPVLRSTAFDELVGGSVFFKMESFQRIGAFKFRGAFNAISQLSPQQRARGVVAFSSGNHAQAVALAARLLETPATIVMPADAPRIKLDATRGYGADIIEYDRYTEDRHEIAAAFAQRTGAALIPPYDDPAIMAGQGTSALELLEETGPLDIVTAPVGGGGLLSGVAVATRELAPDARIIGVEPAAGDDARQSLEAGEIVSIDTPHTIADGAQTQFLGDYTFPVLRSLLERIVTVTDDQIVDALAFFATRMKVFVEPTGALAAAALLARVIDAQGARVGVIVSGGNVDLERFASLVAGR